MKNKTVVSSIDAKEFKEYLLEDIDRIAYILEQIGCHGITVSDSEIRCALPEHTNATSVAVKLTQSIPTSAYSIGFNGDIIGFVQELMKLDFKGAFGYVQALFGFGGGGRVKRTKNPLAQLERLYRKSNRYSQLSKFKINKIRNDNDILWRYMDVPYHTLYEEGISPTIAQQFHIGFDPRGNRILFPHYDWVYTDKLVGLKGRTILNDEEREALNIPKYWNYIRGYLKTNNLYGYNLAMKQVFEKKQLILFEGEKSVLKQFTFNKGQGNSVAVGGHTLSSQQIDFILKQLPSDTEIVFAFDKDVMTGRDITDSNDYHEYLLKISKPLIMLGRSVSYIDDKLDMLGENDAPVDEGLGVWNYLLKHRKTLV